MSEQCEREEAQTGTESEEDREGWVNLNGLVQGVSGKKVRVNGVLDLRTVPEAVVAEIEALNVNGVILLDEANRNSLADVDSHVNGTVMVADPDLRIIVESSIDFSKGAMEAMPAGQKLLLIGTVFFKPDVPPELIAEKFEQLRVIGILIAGEGVHGALMGRMEHTGLSITLADDAGPLVRSVGKNTWMRSYVSRLGDGTTYLNVGVTTVADDVPEELVEQKIAAYHNVGRTIAPEPVLSLLKARSETNAGQFLTPEEAEQEEAEEEEREAEDACE